MWFVRPQAAVSSDHLQQLELCSPGKQEISTILLLILIFDSAHRTELPLIRPTVSVDLREEKALVVMPLLLNVVVYGCWVTVSFSFQGG